ncbi:MAG: 50S ribosomal protein L18 [Lentisphaerae bacterium]|nr:50S ribosomal protein L18 [Lentisphaerota bacterium]
MKLKNRLDYRARRHRRIRRKIRGTAERPRMSVAISNRHIHIQFIDDGAGSTLASVSSTGEGNGFKSINVTAAQTIGKRAAEAAKAKGITQAVFDRGGRKYHGRVKAIAEAARAGGITL